MTKLLFCLLTLLAALNLNANEEKSSLYPVDKVLKVQIKASINPAILSYLKSAYHKANKEDYNLIVLQLNTPGGLVTTTKDILTLFGENDIPIFIWVGPSGASATSAGAIIASSSHLLFMGPGTNMGAATPIQMSGDLDKKSDVRKKSVNDLVALVKSLSESHGRDPKPFMEMISEAKSITAKDALESKLIVGMPTNINELLKFSDQKKIFLKGKEKTINLTPNPEITHFEMDLGQIILNIFSNPSMAYILFLIGAALIYLELQAPGGMIAGALGATCLVLAGIGFQVLPLNIGALGLIILSFLLFFLETFVTSYGILSIAGVVTLLSGSLFLFRTEDSYIHFSSNLVYGSVAAVVAFMGIVFYLFIKDLRSKKNDYFNEQEGKTGIILKELPSDSNEHYNYQVKINGEIWKAESKTKYSIDDHITVIKQDNKDLKLII